MNNSSEQGFRTPKYDEMADLRDKEQLLNLLESEISKVLILSSVLAKSIKVEVEIHGIEKVRNSEDTAYISSIADKISQVTRGHQNPKLFNNDQLAGLINESHKLNDSIVAYIKRFIPDFEI